MTSYRLVTALAAASLCLHALSGSAGDPSPRRLTVRDCLETALRENLEIAVSREDREIARSGVPSAEAAFLPRFTGELSVSRSETPSGSALTGDLSLDQRVYRFDLGASTLLRTGTTLSLDFRNLRQESGSAVSLLSPEYDSSLTLSARHPLLRDAGRETTEAPLWIARAGAEAGDSDFRTRVMDVVAAVRTGFFALHASLREVEARSTALALAERLLARTRAEIEAGTRAPVERLPPEAAAAARKEELIRAEATARNAEDDLKTLLGIPSAGDWDRPLLPDLPAGGVEPPGPEDTFEEALRRRPELSALAGRTRQSELEEAAARNRILPSLALNASAGLTGLSGTPNPSPLFPGIAPTFEGDYGDSVDEMLSGRYYTAFLGLSAEIPWTLRKERAEWVRAKAALARQRLSSESLRAGIRAEVRKARRDLESAIARIGAAAAAVAAAEASLDAEEKKRELGAATSTDVLRSQQEVAEALLARVRAEADARAAQTRLWRSVGTILTKEGIAIR
ncbi:MAG TPA: hypothetical protein DD658_01945 [Deltaproteobacteria bacterium]|nr:MAG: hypothetical protein A2X88_01685 [Deltaproteobacteria bacterium GWC2_65_14]HBO68956.1 hypothetical protein [Deltaproteobacteria bacterium]